MHQVSYSGVPVFTPSPSPPPRLARAPLSILPPLVTDPPNRPPITEKASKTFMFGGKDSLDITITLPSDIIMAGTNFPAQFDVDNRSSRRVDTITLCLIERQQLTSSATTKTQEKVIYQTQTPSNEAASAVAAKSHARLQFIIRPPRGNFSIRAGKSLSISHFVEFR